MYVAFFCEKNKDRSPGLLDSGRSFLVERILNYTLHMQVGCFILEPKPMEKQKDGIYSTEELQSNELLVKKLLNFYRGLGYKAVKRTDYLYLNTDYIN